MSEQDGTQATTLQRPANDDRKAWIAYWKEQGQPWRIEPEFDAERQKYLDELRSITLNLEKGFSPFADIKLSRADIEWLLATHENGHGPIDWSDESQRERKGLDLRGADLRGEDLSNLPLANLVGNIPVSYTFSPELYEKVAIHLERANLVDAHLEGANLSGVHLEGANLYGVHLEGANLYHAHLDRADLSYADLEGAHLIFADLKRAYLHKAHLERADLSSAHLEAAYLKDADLEEAHLFFAHLEGANLFGAHLEGAKLNASFLSSTTILNGVILSGERYGIASLADVHWGEANVSVVDWSAVSIVGDEPVVKREKHLEAYKVAVRAYRQLSVLLRNQGLNEDAAHFAYRAQLMQRKVYWYQRKILQYLGSLSLDLLAGYGYRFKRSFLAYLVVIGIFAALYFHLGAHLAWNEAIVISMTAFHGRGFFPDQFHPGDPQALVAAIEAFVGLLIEVTFIATLTQRLFGK